MKFNRIPQLPHANWETTVEWDSLEHVLARWSDPTSLAPLNMNPDYQREHVWTPAQQENYLEYVLQGGEVGRNITFNCPGWMNNYDGPLEIIDGKQRIEAVRAFYRGDIKVYNHFYHEFTDRPFHASFLFRMTSLKTRREILQLYLNINAGGTPHTRAEIERVQALLTQELLKEKAPKRT